MNKDVIYPSMVIRVQEETINKLEDEVNKQAKAIQIYEKELNKYDNNWNELKEELSDDNKFQLFYADENINTMMTLGAKYYREYILDKIKELENQ